MCWFLNASTAFDTLDIVRKALEWSFKNENFTATPTIYRFSSEESVLLISFSSPPFNTFQSNCYLIGELLRKVCDLCKNYFLLANSCVEIAENKISKLLRRALFLFEDKRCRFTSDRAEVYIKGVFWMPKRNNNMRKTHDINCAIFNVALRNHMVRKLKENWPLVSNYFWFIQ